MSVTLALPHLYDAVRAGFDGETDPPGVLFGFGWRENMKQLDGARRIVFQPGDESGAVGNLVAAKFPGRNPRPLATLLEMVTIFVEAYDAADPENERAQYQITRELWDSCYRHMHRVAYGTFEVLSTKWDNSKNVRRRGAMLVITVAIQAMIPDRTKTTAPTDTAASVTPRLDAQNTGAGTEDPTFIVRKPT